MRFHPKLLLAGLAWVIALLYLTDFKKSPLTASLDQSWMAVIAWAARKPLQFGREIIFTNGPLGYLLYPINLPVVFWPALLIRTAITLLLLTMIFVLPNKLHPVRRVALVVAMLAGAFYNVQTTHVFMIIASAWVLFVRPGSSWFLQICCGAFLAVALLFKGTHLFFILVVIVVGSVYSIGRRDTRSILLALVWIPVAFLLTWIYAGQRISTIPGYLSSSLEMVRGYGLAMSLPPTGAILAAGLTGVAAGSLQIGALLSHHRRDSGSWLMSLFLALGLFLVWKIGFTRADTHTTEFPFYGIPAVLALPMFYGGRLGRPLPAQRFMDYLAVAIMVICGCFVLHNQIGLTPRQIAYQFWARLNSSLSGVRSPVGALARAESAYRAETAKLELPQIKTAVGQATVDVFGYEQAVALTNDLNYTPRPVFQGYCAYTASLIKTNAAFYRSPQAPQYVIFKLQNIDGHIPALDDAEALLVLNQDYQPILAENGYLLMRRKSNAPAAAHLDPAGSGEAMLDEPIPVPDGVIWCQLQIRQTLFGKLLGLLYQLPALQIVADGSAGKLSPYRIIPEPAGNGFLINPFLETDQVTAGAHPGAEIRTVTVLRPRGARWILDRRVRYRFFKVKESDG